MVTVTLTGSTFDLAKQIKGASRQCYGDHDVVARCEQTFNVNVSIISDKLELQSIFGVTHLIYL